MGFGRLGCSGWEVVLEMFLEVRDDRYVDGLDKGGRGWGLRRVLGVDFSNG